MRIDHRPLRLFLDTGVIIAGLFGRWGAAKVILALCTYRRQYTVILAADVERELHGVLLRTGAALNAEERSHLEADLAGWLHRIHIERWPGPTLEELEYHLPTILPVLRHINDLRPVVIAIQAKPDWVISANHDHWSDILAKRTGLRIVTPQEFVRRLGAPEP